MPIDIPAGVSRESLSACVLALADDELMLGHRNSEWTGHSPILEEDIAFSNIAQDELGHALAWYTLFEQLTGKSPDSMVFRRQWPEFTCCRFVVYPKGDFAFTVIRQYLFDAAEEIRMRALRQSTFAPLKEIAAKIGAEEAYHLLHSQGLVERLGDATEESHRRMQEALKAAFPHALGMFEEFKEEASLVRAGIIPESHSLQEEWLGTVIPVLEKAALSAPIDKKGNGVILQVQGDSGGRRGKHTEHLEQLVNDLQLVYKLAPSGRW